MINYPARCVEHVDNQASKQSTRQYYQRKEVIEDPQ